ncbi:hypothetical protein HanIR_Chr15g0775961 [Helianthus annuus]|nr:hypothetical protein HanIR_Chr15g0775961 [Helianthus annuus]
MWKGHTVAFERLVWLKIHGVLLPLSDNKVFDSIGRGFGKIIHAPQLQQEDKDLTTDCVGILIDVRGRIEEEVVVKWEGKRLRVWVEEEREYWSSDCVIENKVGGEEEEAWDLLSEEEDKDEDMTTKARQPKISNVQPEVKVSHGMEKGDKTVNESIPASSMEWILSPSGNLKAATNTGGSSRVDGPEKECENVMDKIHRFLDDLSMEDERLSYNDGGDKNEKGNSEGGVSNFVGQECVD